MLLWLELIVVYQLNHSIPVKNVGLPSRQCTKQVRRHSPLFPHLVPLITQQCERKPIFFGECLHIKMNLSSIEEPICNQNPKPGMHLIISINSRGHVPPQGLHTN